MGNKNEKGGELRADGKQRKSNAGASDSASPQHGAGNSGRVSPGASASASAASASASAAAASGAPQPVGAPSPYEGGDPATLSPSGDGDAAIDPVVANLDKPLTRLPEATSPQAVASNPFGEAFKKTNQSLSVDDYELLKVVGKGSFGKVMQVRKKDTGKIFAMKVLKKAQLVARKQVAHTKTERKVLEDISHPFVCHLKYAFQTDSKLYMILEYFNGGELFFHLKANGRFTEERARYYCAEIVLALECLHAHTIVYRDLKPENVLLDAEGHIRLVDFGLSKEGITPTNLTHTFCGTPEYLAPEVIHGGGYGLPVDWWSLGTLLYEMLTGLPPFYNQNLHAMYERILRAKLHYPAYLSASARSLLQALLDRNPATRLGSNGDAEEVKRHPFFAGLDWNKLVRLELPAPFKPSVTEGVLDTTNVDEEFKRETPRDTPVTQSTLATQQGVTFPGFSFAAPDSNLAAQPSMLQDAVQHG